MAQNPLRRRLTGAMVPTLVAAGAAAVAAIGVVAYQQSTEALPRGCLVQRSPTVGGPVSLTDSAGRPWTQAAFAGAPSVVYFGFTHCPDICPNTMYALGNALASLESDGAGVRTALISIDPARDTPEVMSAYVSAEGFPNGLVGLTGTADQVRAATQAFRVYVSPQEERDGAYNVDHSSFLYIMDGAWALRGMISTAQVREPRDLARCLRAALDEARRP